MQEADFLHDAAQLADNQRAARMHNSSSVSSKWLTQHHFCLQQAMRAPDIALLAVKPGLGNEDCSSRGKFIYGEASKYANTVHDHLTMLNAPNLNLELILLTEKLKMTARTL